MQQRKQKHTKGSYLTQRYSYNRYSSIHLAKNIQCHVNIPLPPKNVISERCEIQRQYTGTEKFELTLHIVQRNEYNANKF